MPVPVFEFTDRAIPVVQIGQFQNAFSGRDRWGRGRWGVGHWGSPLGPAIWTDVTCEVHEITTNTGRGSASDTFVPGTAELVASNLSGWGDADTPIESSYFVDDFDRNGIDLDGFGGDLDYNWVAWPQMVTFRPDSQELVVSRTDSLVTIGASLVNLGGGAVPRPRPEDPTDPAGTQFGQGWGLWGLPYPGDQFLEVDVTGLQAPTAGEPLASSTIELYTHLVAGSLAAQVAIIHWQPAWTDPADTGTLTWTIGRRNSSGTLTTLASGTVGYGAEGFPFLTRFRFEAYADGDLLLLHDGRRLGDAADPAPPVGDRIAVYAAFADGTVPDDPDLRPGALPDGTPRFETLTAGSNLPVPILLEPGTLIRVGVTHAVQGLVWFFHGYVDGLVPVYDPTRTDTVRIECIDALGEVGRTTVLDSFVFHTPATPGNPAGGFRSEELECGQRVARLLNRAGWRAGLSTVDEDSTLTQDTGNETRMLDLLTQTADSCGGAIYGGPTNGHVVFRHQDWQWFEPDSPPDAYITNHPPDPDEFAGPVACPSGWERSWHRADMTTWVQLTNVESFVVQQSNASAIARYGREEKSRSLVTLRPDDLKRLGRRLLMLRGPAKFPRVEAVVFDAATSTAALDLMTSATFTRPSRYRCQLRSDADFKFDSQYLVTGVRHRMARDRWQCRLALDVAAPFAIHGGHWGRARWGRNDWGRYR